MPSITCRNRSGSTAACRLERDAISYMSPNYDPLIETGQMVLLNGDLELSPGISVKVFPGHTANMQAVIIESGRQEGMLHLRPDSD